MLKSMNNEKGVALIAALMILAILTMLGLASVLTSTTDIQIASNEKVATQQQYAAEAGISQALVMLNTSTVAGVLREPTPSITWDTRTDAAYINWNRSVKRTLMDGTNKFSTFSTTVSYKKKTGGAAVAFYNVTSGFSDAPSVTGGWPVYVIRSVARKGNYLTQANILEVTKKSYKFKVNGGFSAGGRVELRGTPTIDGRHYSWDAKPGDPFVPTGTGCKTPDLSVGMPAVFANGSTTSHGIGNDPDLFNSSGQDSLDNRFLATPKPLPMAPWDALGIPYDGPGDEDFVGLFPPSKWPAEFKDGSVITGDNYYQDDDTSGNGAFLNENITGNGLLILHNKEFVPGECKKGVWDGSADSDGGVNDCLPSKKPAKLDAQTGTFKGLIIADEVSLHGNVVIVGSLISLSTIQIQATGSGSPTILYSCQAIEKFAGGQVNRKLNWRKE